MSRVLCTGGCGFVGSVLVPLLLKSGYEIRVVDTLWFGNSLPEETEIIQTDIRNFREEWLEDVNAIIHLAAFSNDPMADGNPMANYTVNAAVTAFIAQRARERKISKFIFGSSCSVYGFTVGKLLEEEFTPEPKFPYAISKLMAERALIALADDSFRPVILRFGTIGGYSPRMRYDLVINLMVASALSKGIISVHNPSLWRPLVDIRDAAQAYVCALENEAEGIFNIVENNYTVKAMALEIAHTLDRQFGVRTEVETTNKFDLRSYQASSEKARDVLGFEAKFSITDTVAYLMGHMDEINDFDNPKYYNVRWCKEKGLL